MVRVVVEGPRRLAALEKDTEVSRSKDTTPSGLGYSILGHSEAKTGWDPAG